MTLSIRFCANVPSEYIYNQSHILLKNRNMTLTIGAVNEVKEFRVKRVHILLTII